MCDRPANSCNDDASSLSGDFCRGQPLELHSCYTEESFTLDVNTRAPAVSGDSELQWQPASSSRVYGHQHAHVSKTQIPLGMSLFSNFLYGIHCQVYKCLLGYPGISSVATCAFLMLKQASPDSLQEGIPFSIILLLVALQLGLGFILPGHSIQTLGRGGESSRGTLAQSNMNAEACYDDRPTRFSRPALAALADEAHCCAICLEQVNCPIAAARLPCRHVFHTDCVKRWLSQSSSCPYRCLQPVTSRYLCQDEGRAVPDGSRFSEVDDAPSFLDSSTRRSAAVLALHHCLWGSSLEVELEHLFALLRSQA